MKLKTAEALALWHGVMQRSLQDGLPDLTARQFALLMQVYLVEPPHTVRGLAQQLAMSKPSVSRALDRLTGLGFVRRATDKADRRSIVVQRTVRGSVFLRDFADLAVKVAKSIED